MRPAAPRRRRRALHSERATLADVARAANVSIASASRALSHPELVSEALCQRVRAAAGDLAYTPGGFGVAAVAGLQRCIGVIAFRLDDGFTAAAVDALAGELARADMSLILAVSDGTPEVTTARLAELLARGASGIALCGVSMPAVSRLPERIPVVSLDGTGAAEANSGAAFSLAQALGLGALYLGDLGHARVALLDIHDPITGRDVKAQGAARGVEVVDETGSDCADELALVSIVRRWVAQDRPITGVVCGSDRAAAALLRACAQQGIAVPDVLAVIGFGNTELSRSTQPALTSLRVSAPAAGLALAQRLAAAVAGRSLASASLRAKLVVRESTMLRVTRVAPPR